MSFAHRPIRRVRLGRTAPQLHQLHAQSRVARAMSCRLIHSSGPWISCMPVNRFGVGTPSSVRREPSVPPRIGRREGLDADPPAGLARQLDRAHVVLQPVAHVAILRRDRAVDPGARLGRLDRGADLPQQIAVSAQTVLLEVAQNEVQRRRGSAAAHLVDVDEALAAVGGLGRQRDLWQVSMILAARCSAFTSLSLAQPGWIETPWTLTTAASAEKVS